MIETGFAAAHPHRGCRVLTAGRELPEAPVAVVLVHGRGASAAGMLDLARDLDRPDLAYLAPQATGGTWYPRTFLAPLEQNEPWLSSSLTVLTEVIDSACRAGIGPERLVLLGFSQGACLSLEFAARNARRYGGVVGLTGGLIGPPGTPRRYDGTLAGTPVFLSAGDPDPHVPWSRVAETARVLTALDAEVSLLRDPGRPHTVTVEEVEAVRAMLATLAPPPR